jgi:hypothetical protein
MTRSGRGDLSYLRVSQGRTGIRQSAVASREVDAQLLQRPSNVSAQEKHCVAEVRKHPGIIARIVRECRLPTRASVVPENEAA